MQKMTKSHATRCLETETKCHTSTLRHIPGRKGTYAVRQMCARTLKFTMCITHVCQCLHIYSRHSCSQILYWLSI